jgi:amylosucrase
VAFSGTLSGRWQVLADKHDAVAEPLGDDLRLALPGYAVRWLQRID